MTDKPKIEIGISPIRLSHNSDDRYFTVNWPLYGIPVLYSTNFVTKDTTPEQVKNIVDGAVAGLLGRLEWVRDQLNAVDLSEADKQTFSDD